MESLRPATAQLENRLRRFGLRLLSLPQGDQAREVVGAPTAIGRRLTDAPAYTRSAGGAVLIEEPETLDAELLQEEEAEAKAEAEKGRPGLTIFADGSRLDSGAAGYSVVWKRGQTWGASKPTWVTTRRPMMQSALPSQGHWKRLREDRLCQSESQSLPMPKPPSDGWPQRSQ